MRRFFAFFHAKKRSKFVQAYKNRILVQCIIINLSVKIVKRFCYCAKNFFEAKTLAVRQVFFIMRIDKFLKVSRILKRRTLAQEACDKGKVSVNGKEVKPAHQIKVGDIVEITYQTGNLKFRVTEIKETVKKDEATKLYEVLSS